MMNEPISTIMSTNLITVSPSDTLAEVQGIFLHNRIHHIPVVDSDKHLMGLITTYDMFKLKTDPREFATIPVEDIMTKRLATLEPEDKIGAAAEVLLEHLFHAVPIVSEGKLAGIITSFDILRYEFKKAYPAHTFATESR